MIERDHGPRLADAEADQRREWIAPTVRRLGAGDAELNVGATGDGVDFS